MFKLLVQCKHTSVYRDQLGNPNHMYSQLEEYTSRDDAVVFLSEDDLGLTGIIIGHVFNPLWSDEYILAKDLFFTGNGRGGASQLLKEYMNWAKDKGACQIMTHCTSGDPYTDKWYEHKGARKLGSIWEVG